MMNDAIPINKELQRYAVTPYLSWIDATKRKPWLINHTFYTSASNTLIVFDGSHYFTARYVSDHFSGKENFFHGDTILHGVQRWAFVPKQDSRFFNITIKNKEVIR